MINGICLIRFRGQKRSHDTKRVGGDDGEFNYWNAVQTKGRETAANAKHDEDEGFSISCTASPVRAFYDLITDFL